MRETMTVTRETKSALATRYRPKHTAELVFLASAIIFGVHFFNIRETGFSWMIIGLVLAAALIFLNSRSILCQINKQNHMVSHSCDGVLGSRFGRKETNFEISDISAIKMTRSLLSQRTTFQIWFVLWGGMEEIKLSGSDLNFSECHAAAMEIRDFLGSDVQFIAED